MSRRKSTINRKRKFKLPLILGSVILVILGLILSFVVLNNLNNGQDERTEAAVNQPQVNFSFGTSTQNNRAPLIINANQTNSDTYLWINSPVTQSFVSFNITLLYDPAQIKSVGIEPIAWNQINPVVLQKSQKNITYSGKSYRAVVIDLGITCDQSRCNPFATMKAPVAKLAISSLTTKPQENSLMIHSNSVATAMSSDSSILAADHPSHKLIINPKPVSPTPFPSSTEITVKASGNYFNDDWPQFAIQIANDQNIFETVKTFTVDGTLKNYAYSHNKPVDASKIRIRFINDSSDRNLTVESLQVGSRVYLSKDPTTYSTGTWTSNDKKCTPGYPQSNALHCTGYFQYIKN